MADNAEIMYQKYELIRKFSNDIGLFGRSCFPTAFAKHSPKAHAEIFKAITDKSLKRVLIAAPRGFAKAQALESKIMTPSGWKLLGGLVVGDEVIGSDGRPTRITHLHPIKEMELYRVTTRDGRSTLCNKGHVWSVYMPQNTKNHKLTNRTVEELLPLYSKERLDKRTGKPYIEKKVFVPTVLPVEYCEEKLPIDPYTLGAWLGDGNSSCGRFTTADEEILEYFPYKTTRHKTKYNYGILGIHPFLRKLCLLNNKHIPECYLFGSIRQREALLQGLIDTDGTIVKGGRNFCFCNKNKVLIDGVVALIRSLGGTATVGEQMTRFDKFSEHKHSYRISARVPEGIIPARLKRKRDLWNGSLKTYSAITDISFSHVGLGRCITVENNDGLYVTDDYLLTHNSTIMSFLCVMHRIAYKKSTEGLFIIIVSESRSQSANFIERIKLHLNESEVFKDLYGDYGEETAKTWREGEIILHNGIRIVAKGAGQSLRGMLSKDDRPNLIIVDDFESEKNAFTPEARAKNRHWITEALIPSLADDGEIKMIGTVISEDCFLMWAKESSIWKVLWYTIIDEKGNSTWEEKFPMSRILAIRKEYEETGSISGFYQEYMNEPQSPDEKPFKPSYIKRHGKEFQLKDGQHFLVSNEEGVEDLPVNVYMGIDPASSLSQTADYFVIAVIAMDSKSNIYLVDLLRQRLDPAKQPKAIIDMFLKYTPRKTTIETTGYQEALRSSVKFLCKEKNIYMSGIERGFKPRTAKNERLLSLVPPLASHRFFFRTGDIIPVQEFLSFPKGKNDDIMDAIWMALSKAKPFSGKVKIKEQGASYKNIKKSVLDWMVL